MSKWWFTKCALRKAIRVLHTLNIRNSGLLQRENKGLLGKKGGWIQTWRIVVDGKLCGHYVLFHAYMCVASPRQNVGKLCNMHCKGSACSKYGSIYGFFYNECKVVQKCHQHCMQQQYLLFTWIQQLCTLHIKCCN